ncbi:MAG: hypothetical protein ABI091_24940 [Ferruginibacter sp.]
MNPHISIFDYLFIPFYLAFFIWRTKKIAKKPEAANLQKYLIAALALRMFGSIAYSMLVEYYYGYGDSFTFYDGGNFFTEQISRSLSNIHYLFASFKETSDWYNSITVSNGYFETPSNNMVMRISAVLSYLSFNKFIIIGLFFGFFSFMGQWKLFLIFDELNNHKNRKMLAYAILFSPSIWFWGSGLLKDSICLGSTGFILYILYQFFVKRNFSIFNLISLFFYIYIVTVIKPYITAIILIGLLVMIFSIFMHSIKHRILRYGIILFSLISLGTIIYLSDFSSVITDITKDSISQIKEFQQSYQAVQENVEDSKAGFDLGDFDPSLSSLILKSPYVVFSCMFRPFLWESRKIIILFTSLETTLALVLTIFVMFKVKIFNFFRVIFTTPYLLFCFSISILFALIIGFTTFNFGTMIRYKIIFLPFYYFMLVNIYSNFRPAEKG